MLINQDQPLEAFLACYTLVNTGAWASTMPVEGPRLHVTFSGKYGGKTSCLRHHNLASALGMFYKTHFLIACSLKYGFTNQNHCLLELWFNTLKP